MKPARPRPRHRFRRLGSHGLLLTLSASLSAALAVLFCLSPPLSDLDSPIQVISYARVMRGELPSADFQNLYGPLGHLVGGWLELPLRRLPPSVATEVYTLLCALVLLGVLLWFATRIRLLYPGTYVMVLLLVPFAFLFLAPFAFYSLAGTLPLLLALPVLAPAIEGAPGQPAASVARAGVGLAIPIQLLTRINFGLYFVVALGITGAAAWLAGQRRVARNVLLCFGFGVLAAVGIVALLQSVGILEPAIADIVQYAGHASASRSVPLRLANPALVALFGAIILAALLPLPGRLRRREIDGRAVTLLLLCGFATYATFRFDPSHLYPGIVMALIAVTEVGRLPAGEVAEPPVSPAPGPLPHWLLAGLLAVMLTALFFGDAGRTAVRLARQFWAGHDSPHFIDRRGVWIRPQDAEVLRKIRTLRAPGEEIFWVSIPGSCQDARDMCVPLTLYLADGSLPRPHVWYFDTATTPYPETQQRIVADLERERTAWIGAVGLIEMNSGLIPVRESTTLWDYIRGHYDEVFHTEWPTVNRRYVIFRRRPMPGEGKPSPMR